MSITTTKLLTAEEFSLLPATQMRRDLVQGEVVETMPTGFRHGRLAFVFGKKLDNWAEEHNAGVVGVETGFILDRDPDVVRAPDVFFVRTERLPPGELPETFADLAPDLAVEVISPSETANEIREKVQDYLAAGTALVIVIYPKTRELVAHTPDGLARTFRSGETFTAPDVLPEFSCAVAELFA
jgi:Uma2 family endonuclease